MNTVAKGDSFEKRSYELIVDAINEGQFGFIPENARVFQKKGYHSHLRDKEIIFDLSIEVWPPQAERYSILLLIECDAEEFIMKLDQVSGVGGHFVKGAMIANGFFSEGALAIAKKARLMLMEVGVDNTLAIKLHKMQRNDSNLSNTSELNAERVLEKLIHGIFANPNVKGLKKLSKQEIASIANKLIQDINHNILANADPIIIDQIAAYFEEKYLLQFDFHADLPTINGTKMWGMFDNERNLIQINKELLNTDRFAFAFSHELGHFILHRDVKINQQLYNDFRDSEYDVLEDRYQFNNFKHWIEWQANCFAAALIIPKGSLEMRLIAKQLDLGISKTGHIYLDNQPVNQRDYQDIVTYLAGHFKTTRTSVIYKLEEFGFITYHQPKDKYKEEIRNIYREIDIIDNEDIIDDSSPF
jgi:Zn-dependent peptidase ImmA (M78 family)